MNKKVYKFLIVLFTIFALTSLLACSKPGPMGRRYVEKAIVSEKLGTKRKAKESVNNSELIKNEFINSYFELAKNIYPDLDETKPNTVVSPLSVYLAFGLLYNGANTVSLEELERFFALDLDSVNEYASNLYAYYNEVNKGIIDTANSVWVNNSRNDYTVKESFLKACQDYYNAEVYFSPFNETTVTDINNWVYNHTDGMIDKTLDEIAKDAIMFLINTVLFDGKWAGETGDYLKFDFQNLDESITKDVDMICGNGNEYYENKAAKGFMKRYNSESGNYAFFGILPDDFEGFYNNNLMQNIYDLYNSQVSGSLSVSYRIPAFSYDYFTNIKDIMLSRGFSNIYDEFNADFTNMFDFDSENVYVSTAFQKARIEVSKEGTKAAAVTVIGMNKATSAEPTKVTYYEVYLDQPFVYCIYDLDNQIPVFIGTIGNL